MFSVAESLGSAELEASVPKGGIRNASTRGFSKGSSEPVSATPGHLGFLIKVDQKANNQIETTDSFYAA